MKIEEVNNSKKEVSFFFFERVNLMKIEYNLIKTEKNTKARLGTIKTNYGTVETPMFMPVGTKATVKGLSPEEVKETGIQAIVIGQNDDDQNANLIASETGTKVYRLNDAMSGDDSLDSYINTMKENLEILKTMF